MPQNAHLTLHFAPFCRFYKAKNTPQKRPQKRPFRKRCGDEFCQKRAIYRHKKTPKKCRSRPHKKIRFTKLLANAFVCYIIHSTHPLRAITLQRMTNIDKEVRLAFQRLNHIFMFLSVLLTAVVVTKWLSFFDIIFHIDNYKVRRPRNVCP